jgi:hypothetical protein
MENDIENEIEWIYMTHFVRIHGKLIRFSFGTPAVWHNICFVTYSIQQLRYIEILLSTMQLVLQYLWRMCLLPNIAF